jgi:hypothetical protein
MKGLYRLLIYLLSLYIGCKLIRYVGGIYVRYSVYRVSHPSPKDTSQFEAGSIEGYKRGNRYREVSILWLEWIMLHLDLLIYAHLFSYFHPPRDEDGRTKVGKAQYTRIAAARALDKETKVG